MGDAKASPVHLSFNPRIRVEFRGATVTSDAGLLLPRELDERLGLSTLIERHFSDPRTRRNYQFPLSRLAGYEDTNDAERVALLRQRRAFSVTLGIMRRCSSSPRSGRGLSRRGDRQTGPDRD